MKIIDESGKQLGDGQQGELLIYGPTITPGYWNRPDATADAVRDGWLHTGDLGYRDADGFYFVVDRAKDMILRGGENVYCIEIENCLADHPEIDEAAVVGVPDAELGEKVKAIVRRVPGAALDEVGVKRHVGRAPGALQGAGDRGVHRSAAAAQCGRQAAQESAARADELAVRVQGRAQVSASRSRTAGRSSQTKWLPGYQCCAGRAPVLPERQHLEGRHDAIGEPAHHQPGFVRHARAQAQRVVPRPGRREPVVRETGGSRLRPPRRRQQPPREGLEAHDGREQRGAGEAGLERGEERRGVAAEPEPGDAERGRSLRLQPTREPAQIPDGLRERGVRPDG